MILIVPDGMVPAGLWVGKAVTSTTGELVVIVDDPRAPLVGRGKTPSRIQGVACTDSVAAIPHTPEAALLVTYWHNQAAKWQRKLQRFDIERAVLKEVIQDLAKG